MGMVDTARRWTRDQVLALPEDGNRYELFDGELLVTPAPSGLHQLTVSRLFGVLTAYVSAHGLGEAMFSPADLDLGGDQLSQPDIFVVPSLPPGRNWSAFPTPVLVVEVLSPATARFDRFVKRLRFQRTGIPEYWIVDVDARAIERWRPEDERPELLNETITWSPAPSTAPLTLDLARFFRDVWGTD